MTVGKHEAATCVCITSPWSILWLYQKVESGKRVLYIYTLYHQTGCLIITNLLSNYWWFVFVFFSSTQVRLSDHNSRGGAEAPEGPLHKWPSLRSVLPGFLGGVGQTRTAVPAVPVSVRWFPHYGGPPPQRPAGWPRCVGHRSHAPQLPLLRLQCFGLILRFSVLLLLGQGGFLLLPSLLCDSGSFFHFGLFHSVSVAATSFPEGSPSKTGWGTDAQRVRVFWSSGNSQELWLCCCSSSPHSSFTSFASFQAKCWPCSTNPARKTCHHWTVPQAALQTQELHVVCVNEPCSGRIFHMECIYVLIKREKTWDLGWISLVSYRYGAAFIKVLEITHVDLIVLTRRIITGFLKYVYIF